MLNHFDIINGNLEKVNDYVKLLAGHEYYITSEILQYQTPYGYGIVDSESNKYGNIGHGNSTGVNVLACTCATAYIKPEKDLLITVMPFGNNIFSWYPAYSYLTVQEINRQITIDPVEHVNESHGIEDTPVGHIISHMGTVAPKHYLICDGAEYNITDYPYLSQYIEDEYGAINYFGGDGINTFCVPQVTENMRVNTNADIDLGNKKLLQ